MSDVDGPGATAPALAGLGTPKYTRADVARLSGLDPELTRRLWRATGFADVDDDATAFTDADVEIVTTLAGLIEGGAVATEVALQLTRVTGQALARVAEVQFDALRDRLLDDEDAPALADVLPVVRPLWEHVLVYVWRRHLAAVAERAELSAKAGEGRPIAVGFADLVGFTERSQELDEDELATMVGRFEAVSFDAVAGERGRVVKVIGDEVLFTHDDPVAAVRAGLAIAQACHEDQVIPDARVGVAWGTALQHEGDVYGTTVNLASRLCRIAFPGSVLVSEDLAAALPETAGIALRSARQRRLKGFGRVRTYRVRPALVGHTPAAAE